MRAMREQDHFSERAATAMVAGKVRCERPARAAASATAYGGR